MPPRHWHETRRPLTDSERQLAGDHWPLLQLLVSPWREVYPEHEDRFLSAASLALCLAAEDYEPHARWAFRSYAWRRIQWALRTEFRRICREAERACTEVDAAIYALDPEPNHEEAVDRADLLEYLLSRLSARRRAILAELLKGQSEKTVARQFGVSHQRINQSYHRSIAMMRREL